MHRPFDGAFPALLPGRTRHTAMYRSPVPADGLSQTIPTRDRAYNMMLMAEAGLHSFDYDSGKLVNAELEKAHLDEDAKHTFILNLHPHPSVGKLLLQRCGMSSRWLTSNRARLPVPTSHPALSTSRRPSPATWSNAHGRRQPRHLLHHRSRLPDTGTFRRRKRAVHTIVAANWVHHPEHPERLVDAGCTAWRTPPAQTK